MNITSSPVRDLAPEGIRAWSDLQRADPAVDNPSFRPEFAAAVAAVRDDVEVAVIRKDGRYVGFLPFHRDRHNVGRPLAEILSDMHGIVAEPELDWNGTLLLRACGLSAWHFDHLIASQAPLLAYHQVLDDSPFMDLSDGFEAYVQQRRQAGCSSLNQAQRKRRKLERDVGPVRFELHTTDAQALRKLVQWKQAQLAAADYFDMFRLEWVVPLLQRITDTATDDFRGLLSVLYAGDRLVAVHLGLLSRQVLSSWIPTYDPAFGKYSPGLLLHLEMARSAAERGVRRVDLCRGRNQLKDSLASGAFPVAIGCVDRRPLNRMLRCGWFRTRELVYASPFRTSSLKLYRRMRNWMAYQSQRKAIQHDGN